METVELRLVYQDFRRPDKTLTIERRNDDAGNPIFIDFEGGSHKLFITAAKNVEDDAGKRRVLYVDTGPLNAHPLTPSRVPPERSLWNTKWDGNWVLQNTNETGKAAVSFSLQGQVKGDLTNEVDGQGYKLSAELKTPTTFYAGDLTSNGHLQRKHVRGEIKLSNDSQMMLLTIEDLDVSGKFVLNLACSFRAK